MPSRAPIRCSAKSLRTTDSPINFFIRHALENPGIISLAAGLVDPVTLPAAEVAEAAAYVLSRPGAARAALQYGTTHGHPALREKVLARLADLDDTTPADLHLTPEDVVVTTGSQQLLYLVSELLLDPGDIVITEAPSYFVYQNALASAGARALSVPLDEDGMNTDALAELLERLDRTGEIARLRFIYVVDYFQNPTGLSLSLPRRQHLLELARKYSKDHRILIVEDAAYRELRYAGPDLPSIKSFDTSNEHVLLAMTFSKPCAPGLKTGYAFLPRELVTPLLRIKGNHDFGSSNLIQHLLDRLLETGAYDRHVADLCQSYRAKRDAMLEALDDELGGCGPEVRWTHPGGGLYVWLRFPPDIATGTDSPLMKAALSQEVLYVPGEFCYLSEAGPCATNEARLSFGVATCEQIRTGIRRLAQAFRDVAGKNRTVLRCNA